VAAKGNDYISPRTCGRRTGQTWEIEGLVGPFRYRLHRQLSTRAVQRARHVRWHPWVTVKKYDCSEKRHPVED
jgi:hypothetical protein